jgi:hypothetical protein
MSSDKRRTGAERMWRGRDGVPLDVIDGKAVEIDTETLSLGARLSELLAEESPDSLLLRLQTFKRSVEDALARSSSAFQILRQLESAGLKDCARCTAELEQRLARNAHFQVLGKLAEAESLLADLSAPRR